MVGVWNLEEEPERLSMGVAKATPAFNAQTLLARNIRIEEDLIDQLFNSSEKRLACTLLLARYGKRDRPARVVPRISQATLAETIGTTRSRVDFSLNKFKKLGFIEYNGELPLKINGSLLSVVLHD
jgi:CRP/FNR family transcriptional regulator, cyclic AMP receptor protein